MTIAKMARSYLILKSMRYLRYSLFLSVSYLMRYRHANRLRRKNTNQTLFIHQNQSKVQFHPFISVRKVPPLNMKSTLFMLIILRNIHMPIAQATNIISCSSILNKNRTKEEVSQFLLHRSKQQVRLQMLRMMMECQPSRKRYAAQVIHPLKAKVSSMTMQLSSISNSCPFRQYFLQMRQRRAGMSRSPKSYMPIQILQYTIFEQLAVGWSLENKVSLIQESLMLLIVSSDSSYYFITFCRPTSYFRRRRVSGEDLAPSYQSQPKRSSGSEGMLGGLYWGFQEITLGGASRTFYFQVLRLVYIGWLRLFFLLQAHSECLFILFVFLAELSRVQKIFFQCLFEGAELRKLDFDHMHLKLCIFLKEFDFILIVVVIALHFYLLSKQFYLFPPLLKHLQHPFGLKLDLMFSLLIMLVDHIRYLPVVALIFAELDLKHAH